jgi:hypothetical protein
MIFQLRVTQLIQILKKQPADHPLNWFSGLSAFRAGFVNATANVVEWLPIDPLINLLKAFSRP